MRRRGDVFIEEYGVDAVILITRIPPRKRTVIIILGLHSHHVGRRLIHWLVLPISTIVEYNEILSQITLKKKKTRKIFQLTKRVKKIKIKK